MSPDDLFDYSKSRALLIGTSEYENEGEFPNIPAADNSLQGMYEILTNPKLCGWPRDRVRRLSNQSDMPKVTAKLRKLTEEAEEVFLLYYVGHGWTDGSEVYLTLTDTKTENVDVTSLPYQKVRQALLRSRAKTKIVILDSCFSGRTISNGLSVQSQVLEIKGTFTLTAADHSAHVPEDEGTTCTSFTGELLELIRTGLQGGPGILTLDEIYFQLKRNLKSANLPEPNSSGTDTVRAFPFARNATLLPGPPISRFPQKPPPPVAPQEPESALLQPAQRPQPTAPRSRLWRKWGIATVAVVVLAGITAFTVKRLDAPSQPCGPTAGATVSPGSPVVITSDLDSSPEDQLIAYIYQDALQENGIRVSPNITPSLRSTYYNQVCSGEITVVPEYNGALLTEAVDGGSTAVTTAAINSALEQALPPSLEILNAAPAQDQDSVTVTESTAKQHGLRSIADLRRWAGKWTLGAPLEFNTRKQGAVGLKSKYGIVFGTFDSLNYNDDSNVAVTDLMDGSVQAADVYTTNPEISSDHLVVLKDPDNLFRAENVVPLVYKPAVQANPAIATVLNYVSLQLTQSQLEDVDLDVAKAGANPQAIAQAWVQKHL